MKTPTKALLFMFFISLLLLICPLHLQAEEEVSTQIKNIQILITDEDHKKVINVSIEDIKKRLLKGEPVHFVEKQDKAKRTIEAEWIINALKKEYGVEKIDIKNAIINGDLDFQINKNPVNIEESDIEENEVQDLKAIGVEKVCFVSPSINITSCWLQGNLQAGYNRKLKSFVIFESSVSFSDSKFLEEVYFNRAHFNGRVSFLDASFKEKVDFGTASFNDEANFKSSKFNDEVNFYSASFNGEALFKDTSFNGEADFIGASFTGLAYFYNASFKGKAIFSYASFNGRAGFSFASFNDEADFNKASFKGKATFSHASFNGEADFGYNIFNGMTDFGSTSFKDYAQFTEASFNSKAEFVSASFNDYVEFKKASFNDETYFYEAIFNGMADFDSASFKGMANFVSANFNGEAYFGGSSFNGRTGFSKSFFNDEVNFYNASFNDEAYFIGTSFNGNADFSLARLEKANMTNAILDKSKFIDTNLKDSIFAGVNLTGSQYEPNSSPYKGSLGGIKGLKTVWFKKGKQSGLVQLRAALKEAGLRDLEREATYAIEHWKAYWEPWYKKCVKHLLFEWTCGYGLNYLQPLLILCGLVVAFSIPYSIAIETRGPDGIWKVWSRERIRRDLGGDELELIFRRGLPVVGYAFYFSLLSAFHIGWRDLNVGSWITRIQPREYTMKATGWVRVVSGVQSLISIYLLALWILTQFGRPFE